VQVTTLFIFQHPMHGILKPYVLHEYRSYNQRHNSSKSWTQDSHSSWSKSHWQKCLVDIRVGHIETHSFLVSWSKPFIMKNKLLAHKITLCMKYFMKLLVFIGSAMHTTIHIVHWYIGRSIVSTPMICEIWYMWKLYLCYFNTPWVHVALISRLTSKLTTLSTKTDMGYNKREWAVY
jgi:hypothetical protein